MRSTQLLLASSALVVIGALTTFAWTQGQDKQPAPVGDKKAAEVRPGRDESKLPFFQQTIFRGGRSGSEWLLRANRRDGRFVYGIMPAVNQEMEGDSFVRQVGAAFALAKAAKYYNDDESAARARQAVLTLLLDTAVENNIRFTTLPPGLANRLCGAAMLVQAIHELPAPATDLLDQADQLCNFLKRAQRADGSFACHEPEADGKAVPDDNDSMNYYPGEALYALMRSQQHRPAAWKLEAVRKALPFYQARWRANKTLASISRQSAAFAEAFAATKDKVYADYVFEMNDWLCTFQLRQLDPLHPLWAGGFLGCVEGKPVQMPPHIGSAVYADSLAEAARVARQVGDATRWQRYKDTLERSLQFLTSLQYTTANARHFASWYQPYVVGAFHASHTDGNIRLDYTQQAVCAMVGYMMYAADAP